MAAPSNVAVRLMSVLSGGWLPQEVLSKCSGKVNYSYLLVLKWRGLTRKFPPTKEKVYAFFCCFNCQNYIEVDGKLK